MELEEILEFFFRNAIMGSGNHLVPGENIAKEPELKISFEKFGLNDDEEFDKNEQGYVLFLHKNALSKDFIFPNHESSYGLANSRPADEVSVFAWYNVEDNVLSIRNLDEDIAETELKKTQVKKVLEGLNKKYMEVPPALKPNAGWPFG